MPEITGAGNARPAWYDRGPIQTLRSYTNNLVAPHASNIRWSFTVPAGKKASISLFALLALRDGVATTVGRVICYHNVTPSGGVPTAMGYVSIVTNALGDNMRLHAGSNMFLAAADLIEGVTADTSTGGTVNYLNIAAIVEYDA